MELNKNFLVRGPRIYLRSLRVDDAEGNYHGWINDPEVTRYLVSRIGRQSVADIEAYIRASIAKPDEVMLAACRNGSDEHIGNLKLEHINETHKSGWMSIVMGRQSEQGRGIGTEAIALTTLVAFRHLDLRRIDAGCFAENKGAVRAFEKCGYLREGFTREQFLADGKAWDAVWLGLLAHDPPLWRDIINENEE